MKLKPLVMQVRPHLLFKPDLTTGSSPPDPSTCFQLLDRVVNVRQGYAVPVGLRGTVISIKNAAKAMDVVYEVLFDAEFSGGLPIRGIKDSPARIYHLPSWALINLSHGRRQQAERERQGKPTAVVRPSGSSVKQTPAQSQPQRQNYPSYKAAVEHQQQPAQAKPAQHTKILTRQKSDATSAKQQPTSSKGPAKKAPSPSSLPTPSPFLDIWNSLLQQHQQQTNGGQAAASAPVPQEVSKGQQAKSKTKETSVPPAPKLPSLQVPYQTIIKPTLRGLCY